MSSKDKVTGIILAGGLGTRLRDVAPDKPKSILDINNRPFITYLLDQMNSAGLKDVIICSGYLSEQLEEVIGNQYNNLEIHYSIEEIPLGTGGALRLALPKVETDYLLVMNGDSYIDFNMGSFINWFNERSYGSALCAIKKENTSRYGRLTLSSKRRIISFIEKKPEEIPGYINGGIYLFQKEILAKIPKGIKYSLEKSFLPSLLEEGLYGYLCEKEFIDIGTPESYKEASNFINKVIG
ncbi:nucleotidyltransferase family protein [Gammaproteobacteria bacterium]|nr:nucleotidyltransferase family protein [Gammaproteobacteria bacterium]